MGPRTATVRLFKQGAGIMEVAGVDSIGQRNTQLQMGDYGGVWWRDWGITKWHWSSINKHPASVFGVLRLFGGYQPAQWVRRASSLSTLEGEAISRGLASGHSMRQIAEELNRPLPLHTFFLFLAESGRSWWRLRYRCYLTSKSWRALRRDFAS